LRGALQATAQPNDLATLYPPLLAYSVTLCRKYGYPEHLAEDFVQEVWARSFRRLDADRTREEAYHYLRSRLLGLFKGKKQAVSLRAVWRGRDDSYPANLSLAQREFIGVD
jgi:DNA-directed RNA polymerase specialized sigma24 family protein